MKKVTIQILIGIVLCVFALGISSPPIASAAESGLKYTIVVSKFENRSNWSGRFNLGDAYGAVLIDILNQTGKFVVLAENDMRSAAAKEGSSNARLIPAQLLVKGVITHAQSTGGQTGGLAVGGIVLGGSNAKSEINITMYVVEAGTGRVVASKSVIGKAEKGGILIGGRGAVFNNYGAQNLGKAVEDAATQAVNWMVGQLPQVKWTGRVVMNANGNIYINRGTREGVVVGQTFSVGSAEVLRDPTTGEVLDEIVQEVAVIKVISVKEKISICEVTMGNGEAITTGMHVIHNS